MKHVLSALVKITLVLLALSCAKCMKQSEAGSNDWHMKNIGAVTHLYPARNHRLFFMSELGQFGHLSQETGQIQTRKTLNSDEKLLSINAKEITIATSINQIITYRVQTLDKLVDSRLTAQKGNQEIGTLVAYLRKESPHSSSSTSGDRTENLIYVVGEKQARIYSKQNLEYESLVTAKQNEILLNLVQVQDKIYLLSQQDHKLYMREIVGKRAENIYSLNVDIGRYSTVQRTLNTKEHICFQLSNGHTICKDPVRSRQQGDRSDKQVIDRKVIGASNSNHLIVENGVYSLDQRKYLNHRTVEDGQGSSVTVQCSPQERTINLYRNEYRMSLIANYGSQNVRNVWLSFKSPVAYDLVIQFADLELALYRFNEEGPSKMWSRQESLAYIDRIVFMKTETENRLNNVYHRKLLSSQYQNNSFIQKILAAPILFAERVISEIVDLKAKIIEQINHLRELSESNLDFKSLRKFTMSEEQEQKYGLRKNIFAITKHQTVFAIDSKTSKIVWKTHANFANRSLVSLLKLKRDYQEQVALAIVFDPVSKTTSIQEITANGRIRPLKQFQTGEFPTIHRLNDYSLILKDGKNLQKFAVNEQLSAQHLEKEYYFYSIEDKTVNGWVQSKGLIGQIWNLELAENETLVASTTSFRGENSRVPLVDQEKVIFKNIDFTNIAVLTRSGNHLHAYAINGRTGHVQFNQYQVGVSFEHPINLAYDENNILISYFSLRNRVYEIWTIEQYQDRVETSALNILKDYFNDFTLTPTHNRNRIIFLSEVYGSVVPIKLFFITESRLSLIRRNMIVVSQDNQCYTITRELISARRPKETAIFSNQKYPPYDYLLPYSPVNYLTHLEQLSEIETMRFSATDLESTIFMFAYGIDVFLIRMAPDRTFDMITEDFNHIFLIAIVILVTLAVYYLKTRVKNAKLMKNYRD